MPATFASFFAQATTATSGTPAPTDASSGGGGGITMFLYFVALIGLVYFMMIRPQSLAKKKQEELVKSAKTGDRIVTTSGIHGVISNVKDTTVILKVADNVKLEIEKTHIDKVVREGAEAEKVAVTKS